MNKIEKIEQQWEYGCESGNLDAGDLFGQLLEIANNLDYKLRISNEKIELSLKALKDISKWNEALEDVWDDPGHRANDAITKLTK